MYKLIATAGALVLLSVVMAGTSPAQSSGSSSTQILTGNYLSAAAQRGLPYGSYNETCRDIRNNGYRLDAICQKRDGGWRNTSIDYRGCRGEIVNDNGHLRCGQGGSGYPGGGWQGGGLPRGDYKQSCQDMHMSGNRLDARCQKRNGGWRNTSLNNAYSCNTIVNDDGHLRCR